jgi:hypothetical protein
MAVVYFGKNTFQFHRNVAALPPSHRTLHYVRKKISNLLLLIVQSCAQFSVDSPSPDCSSYRFIQVDVR